MRNFSQIIQLFVGIVILAYFQVEGSSNSPPRSPSGKPRASRSTSTSWSNRFRNSGLVGNIKSAFGGGSFRSSSLSNEGQRVIGGSLRRQDSWSNLEASKKTLYDIQFALLDLFVLDPSSKTMFDTLKDYQKLDVVDGIEKMEAFFQRFQYAMPKPEKPNSWNYKNFCSSACLNLYGYVHKHDPEENNPTLEKLYTTVLISITEPVTATAVSRVRSVFRLGSTYNCGCNTRSAFLKLLKDSNIDPAEFTSRKKQDNEGPTEALSWLDKRTKGSDLIMVTFPMYMDYLVDALKGVIDGSPEAIQRAIAGLKTPKPGRQLSVNNRQTSINNRG